MSEWKPIATAPKDGEHILICRDNDVFWEYEIVRWAGDDFDYPWERPDASNAFADGRFTLWMPLPPPPKPSQEE